MYRTLKSNRHKKGFTLLEMLIAVSIFAVVSILGVTVFIDISRAQRNISLENSVIEDGRFIMDQIVHDMQNNAIDYEEYYNKKVLNGKTGADYGTFHGAYSEQFHDFGTPDEIGTNCNGQPTTCIVQAATIDQNMGKSPIDEGDGTQSMTAMCTNPGCSDIPSLYNQAELYLISPDGKNKTMYRLLKKNSTDTDNYLGFYKMTGQDTDQNGIYNTYTAAEGFDAPETGETINAAPADFFERISPKRINILNIDFFITPVEDPHKAFAEPDMQMHPRVTIILEIEPSSTAKGESSSNVQSMKIQTTISSRIYTEVKSFPAKTTEKVTPP